MDYTKRLMYYVIGLTYEFLGFLQVLIYRKYLDSPYYFLNDNNG